MVLVEGRGGGKQNSSLGLSASGPVVLSQLEP